MNFKRTTTSPSDLNKRITLQAPTKVPDGMGNFDETWTDMGDPIWAGIWPTSANQSIQSLQPVGTITHRIRIRYRSVLRSSWRIKFGNRYFAIVAPPINPNEKNEFLDLLCKEAA